MSGSQHPGPSDFISSGFGPLGFGPPDFGPLGFGPPGPDCNYLSIGDEPLDLTKGKLNDQPLDLSKAKAIQRNERQSFLCGIEGCTFSTFKKISLYAHKRNHVVGEKTKCSFVDCDKEFVHKSLLKMHKKFYH